MPWPGTTTGRLGRPSRATTSLASWASRRAPKWAGSWKSSGRKASPARSAGETKLSTALAGWSSAGGIGSAGMADADCLFCGIVAGTIPSETIDSDERTVAFMDINPATAGHALVVPRQHSADLLEIGEDDLAATALAAQRLARRMKDVLGADGINLINACGAAAWQTVFHFHIHVVPRYEGDPLKLPWVPEAGDANEIAQVAKRLRGEDD